MSDNQMTVDDCLVEAARKLKADAPQDTDWPRIVSDLVRIIDQLTKERNEALEAIRRQVK
jgi:hypothetical protein